MIPPQVEQEQNIYSNAAVKLNVKDPTSMFAAVIGFLNDFLLTCGAEVAAHAATDQAS